MLSTRERYIAAVTLIAVGIFAFDRLALRPLEARRARLAEERRRILAELEEARLLFARRRRTEPEWRELLGRGLATDAWEAASAVLHAVRNWSEESGLSLTSVQPEKAGEKGSLRELTFRAAGTGGIEAVAGFLWRLENASIPLRLTELQVGSRKEGADDLSLQVRISALVPSGGMAEEGTPVVAQRGGGDDGER